MNMNVMYNMIDNPFETLYYLDELVSVLSSENTDVVIEEDLDALALEAFVDSLFQDVVDLVYLDALDQVGGG